MEFNIKLTKEDLGILSTALIELPFKLSAPLIDKINKQIAEHAKNADAEKAKEEKKNG